MKRNEIFKYVIVLLVTAGLFATIFYVTDVANARRVSSIRVAQDTIAINLLSSETQFSLLQKTDCSSDLEQGLFQNDLKSVGDRLTYLESTVGSTDDEVVNLKRYYQLLELKDYLLIDELAAKCHLKPTTVIYFTSDTCGTDCEREDDTISQLRDKYPDLRIYTFDTSLDLAAISTLQDVTKIPDTVPSLVVDDKPYPGFQSVSDVEKAAPELLPKPVIVKKKSSVPKVETSSTSVTTASTASTDATTAITVTQ